jgi:transcription elongation GreA/GreB family factor
MNKDLLILEADKDAARMRIAELDAEIMAMGPDFYEAFNQTSETWHDNFPFEALRDRQTLLSTELQNLKHILQNSLPSIPKQKKGVVGIGSYVTVKNQKTGKKVVYFIAGDWTLRAGQIFDDAMIMSRNSPLASKLFGKKVGSEILFNDTLIIESIE